MGRWTNFITQVLGFTVQVIIPTFVMNPEKRIAIHGAVAVVQGVVGGVAHYYNPDGTPAKTAYNPEK